MFALYTSRLRSQLCLWGVLALASLWLSNAGADVERPKDSNRATTNTAERGVLRLGVLAKDGKPICRKQWGPLADYLTRTVPDHTFEMVPLTLDEMIDHAHKGTIDLMLTNSMQYTELNVELGLSPLATMVNLRMDTPCTMFSAVIFTRADRDDINTIEDLRGKSFGAVAEKAFGGWRMAVREIRRRGLEPEKFLGEVRFLGPQPNIAMAVRNGDLDAGTVRTDTLERMQLRGKIRMEDFKILNRQPSVPDFPFVRSTDLYPEWPFAELPHVDDAVGQDIVQALLAMQPDDPAAQAGMIAGWTVPSSYEGVDQCLWELRLGPYRGVRKHTYVDVFQEHRPLVTVVALSIFLILLFSILILLTNRRLTRMAHHLQISEMHHRLMFQENQTVEILLDPETACIVDANPAAAQFYGYPLEQLIGMHMSRVNSLPPDEAAETMADAMTGRRRHFFFREKLAGDRIRDVEAHISSMVIDGKPRLFSIVHDITERRETEEALRQSREKLNGILSQVTDVVWSLKWPDMTPEYLSPSVEEVLGYPVDAFMENPALWSEITLPDDRHINEEALEEASRGDRVTYEVRVCRRDGQVIHARCNCKMIRGKNGEPLRLEGVTSDITAAREREERRLLLERQHQRLRRHESLMTMAGAIAHNFNNRLQAILGYLELILEDHEEDSQTHAMALQARESAERASKLSGLMHLYVGQGKPYEACEMNELVAREVDRANRKAPDGVRIRLSADDEAPHQVLGDSGRLCEALHNVLINAVEAMEGSEGTIRVGLLRKQLTEVDLVESRVLHKPEPGSFVCVRVTDSGCGMDEAARERLLEPYFTTKFAGRGLGLAATYGIVQGHNGVIFVVTRESVGTEFSLCFPELEEQSPNISFGGRPRDHSGRAEY